MSTDRQRTLNSEYGPSDRWFVLTIVALDYFVLILHRKVLGFIKAPLSAELLLTNAEFGWLDTAFLAPGLHQNLWVN